MQIDPKKKRLKLIISIVLAVVLLGASAYMVINTFISPSGSDIDEIDFVFETGGEIELADELIGDIGEAERTTAQALLDGLVKFGDWPVTVSLENLGRSNPFLPVF